MLSFTPNCVTAVVLGIMQDGGLPHTGCRCPRCRAAFANPAAGQYAACLALVDTRETPTAVYLFDATPNITHQLELLADALGPHPQRPQRLRQPDGLFLTHGHMGHTAGLPQLGPEAMAVQGLPIYAPDGLVNVLLNTPLWQPLLQNCRLVPLSDGQKLDMALDVSVTAVAVPHRDEWDAGTLAFRIQGPQRSLLYLPDIDAWHLWRDAEEVLASVDVALIDGSFYSREELAGRAPVAHPLIEQTLALFTDLPTQLVLTHINHTNPVLDEGSAAQTAVAQSGATIAYTGQQFIL